MGPVVSTPTDLDELDRLRAAATQGEWRAPAKVNIAVHADDCAIYVNRPVGDEAPETRARWDADARWIATAHNAYPAMAAELRELRAKVAELTAMNMGLEQMLDEAEPIVQTRGPKP